MKRIKTYITCVIFLSGFLAVITGCGTDATGSNNANESVVLHRNAEIDDVVSFSLRSMIVAQYENGNMIGKFVKTGEILWTYEVGAAVAYPSYSSKGNRIYFGSHNGNLYALDASTGEEKWIFKAAEDILSWPTVVDDRVLFGCNGCNFYAVDANTGTEIWKFETGGGPMMSRAIVWNGIVLFGATNGLFFALDQKTGERKWQFETGGPIRTPAKVRDGQVTFTSEDRHRYTVDIATGKETNRSLVK